jgi:hypothetical protein
MVAEMKTLPIDLVRWSFTINSAQRGAIESHLADLGADVLIRDGQDVIVTWDEPEDELSEVIEAIWALNGEPFHVIQEEFQRHGLHTIHHVDDESGEAAA